MKRCLVIGASGLVGEYLVKSLNEAGEYPIATYCSTPMDGAERLDICQQMAVDALIEKSQPDIIYLPAALTNVDYCENHPEESYLPNVVGVKNVVDASNKVGARVIYFSTDYIFDGTAGPYDELATANPISEYGKQKLAAEHYIVLTSINYLIVRTTVVYGWEKQGKNFVYRLVKSLREGTTVRVPDDQIGTPTYAPNLAQNAVTLSRTEIRGVVNIAGPDIVSRYKFALETARIFKLPTGLIIPISTRELNQSARRPLLAGLITNKAEKILNLSIISYENGLGLMLAREKRPVVPYK